MILHTYITHQEMLQDLDKNPHSLYVFHAIERSIKEGPLTTFESERR